MLNTTFLKKNYKLKTNNTFRNEKIKFSIANMFVEPTYDKDHVDWFIKHLRDQRISHLVYENKTGRQFILVDTV